MPYGTSLRKNRFLGCGRNQTALARLREEAADLSIQIGICDNIVYHKNVLKSILQKILAGLARRVIRRYEPIIIGITGSVGKTSTRDAIAVVARKRYSVRTAEKNYNTEMGLPLTILGMEHYGRNIFLWAIHLAAAFFRITFDRESYPEALVLEYGIDRPGDMDVLISIVRPHIAVFTSIGDIPVHVEYFRDPEALVAEKTKLAAATPADGYVILNYDDSRVLAMKTRAHAKIVTYGKSLGADVRVMNSELQMKKDDIFGEIPDGMSFKIHYKGKATPALLPRV